MTESNIAHPEELECWQKSQTTFTTGERVDSRGYHFVHEEGFPQGPPLKAYYWPYQPGNSGSARMICARCGGEVVDIAGYKPDRRVRRRDHLHCGLVCVSCGRWQGWETPAPVEVGDTVLERGAEATLSLRGMADDPQDDQRVGG